MKPAEILITATACDNIDRVTSFLRHCCDRSLGSPALVDTDGQPLRLQLKRTADGYQIQVASAPRS